MPEQYRASAARVTNIDPDIAERHDLMHFAYKKLQEIDTKSIHNLQDQGSSEIIISILAAHMKQVLDNIGKTSDEAEKQLDRIANEAQLIESNAIKDGSIQIIEASMEILDKYMLIAHRLELINHRSTPDISCKAVKFNFDGAGDGGQLSPDIGIKHRGNMPYCGPTYGLTDMNVIAESLFQKDSERVEVTRQKGKAVKRSAPGDEPNPSAPDLVGDGLFKAGTTHKDGIFQCPTDMQLDITQGHTQSEVLDRISAAIRRLRQLEATLGMTQNGCSKTLQISQQQRSRRPKQRAVSKLMLHEPTSKSKQLEQRQSSSASSS